jgi:pilus assembly protein CpaE
VSSISGPTIRILLISARAGARDEMALALEQRSREYRLYWVSQYEVALARAQDLVPHVIIVDDELDGNTSVALIASLIQRVPSAAVVALISPDAVGKANQAVLAGARAFLVKPLQTEELLDTLRFVLGQGRPIHTSELSSEDMSGKIVAVVSPKGGTGRTTTAINLGYWLMQLTKLPAVLVDTDYAAPALDVVLNLHSERTIVDLLPRIARIDVELMDSILETHHSGLKVLLAPSPALWNQDISLPHVQQILAQLQRMFGWVVIDLGLQLSEMAFAYLDSADHIVMTVLPEMVGLRNATWMLSQLRARGYPDDRVWLVINRATLRGGITRSDIEQHLHINVKHIIPDDQHLATYAINRGVPFSMSHPHAAVSRAMRGLAELLARNMPPQPEPEAKDAKVEHRNAWPWTRRKPAAN